MGHCYDAVFHSFASSVTSCGDKALIANELLELHSNENKSPNLIVSCKNREKSKSIRKEIRTNFSEKTKQKLLPTHRYVVKPTVS